MCEPVSIVLGVVSAGLGIAQSVASYQQAQENVAYQNAVNEQNYQFSLMQTSAQRSFEQMRYDQQEELIRQNDYFARVAAANEISQLNLRYDQEQEATAGKKREGFLQRLQARGEILAAGRQGNSIDNLLADVERQWGAYDYLTSRQLAFAGTQLQEQKKGTMAELASRLGSVQPYIKQPVLDPLKPIPMAAPSATPYILGGVSSAVGAAASAYSMGMKTKGSGGGGVPPPTPSKGATATAWNGGFSYQPSTTIAAPNYSGYFRG